MADNQLIRHRLRSRLSGDRNAANQAEKEIATRYDLKRVGSKLLIEAESLVLESADDFTLAQAREVVETKLVRRGVHLKSLRRGDIEPASGGRVRQKLTFPAGYPAGDGEE